MDSTGHPKRPPRWPVLVALALPLTLAFTWRFWNTPDVHTESPSSGRDLYARCQACHGPAGRGIAGYAPALVNSPALRDSNQALARRILTGVGTDPVSTRWGSRMTGFAPHFSDMEIAALVDWLHQTWGDATLPPMNAAEVSTLRSQVPLVGP